MKNNIHPKYYINTKVSCACGNSFTTGSTLKEIKIEICSNCHPFYTGKMKYIDTMGRVEKFQKKQKRAQKVQEKIRKINKIKERSRKEEEGGPKTLREMLLGK